MKNWKKEIIDVLILTFGAAIAAISFDLFLFPLHITPGGVSSIAAILSDKTGLSTGLYILLLNIPLFLASFKMNKRFFIKSLLGMFLNAAFVDIFAKINPAVLGIGEDYILAAVFGGAGIGIGYGLVIYSGGSTGGTDIAGWLVKRKIPSLPIGGAILITDLLIISAQSIIFGNIKLSLYAVIALYVDTKIIDYMVEGINFAKVAYIISEKGEEISMQIMQKTGRGVTGLKAVGMYTKNSKNLLMCTMRRAEVAEIKRIVKDLDPKAFFILSDAREVIGEGFNN